MPDTPAGVACPALPDSPPPSQGRDLAGAKRGKKNDKAWSFYRGHAIETVALQLSVRSWWFAEVDSLLSSNH